MTRQELVTEFETWINTQPKNANIMQVLFSFAEHVVKLDRANRTTEEPS